MKLGIFVSDFRYDVKTLDKVKTDEIGIFLVQDGVYNAVLKENGKSSDILEKGKVFALGDDIKFRGFKEDQVDERVEVVGYEDIVDLMMNNYEKLIWL
ncbi:MAG TPA: sulfurtransferase complex subunit TusB [Euryarchaeota archaeon]|nr:sulfurtransferase complex subunit TusB [Euryarchaeota archaeon]